VIPADLRAAVEHHLAAGSRPVRIEQATRVGGGCISPAVRLETSAGPFFLKWRDAGSPDGLLIAEARSLEALGEPGVVRVPAIEAVERDWLLLEWLEPGVSETSTWIQLGERLAALHRVMAASPGWPADNFIGSLAQTNEPIADWPAFWAERRLLPQWDAVSRRGMFDASDGRSFDRLLEGLGEMLQAGRDDGASLLHGDLWSGNVHVMNDGVAALIDPSSCYGHREVDLAMAELFGGFDGVFHEAYRATWPLQPGYTERRDIYQLYYMLVHVNLFGRGYVAGTRSILARYGG
jgi:fructosamine-3-kinase